MEKRLLIALALAAIVILVSQKLFPSPVLPIKQAIDTSTVAVANDSITGVHVSDSGKVVQPVSAAEKLGKTRGVDTTVARADTLSVVTPKATYHFSSVGA